MVLILFRIDCLLSGMYDICYLAIRIIPSSVLRLSHFCEKNISSYLACSTYILSDKSVTQTLGHLAKTIFVLAKIGGLQHSLIKVTFPIHPILQTNAGKKIPVWLIRQHQRLKFYLQVYLWARIFYYTLVNQFGILVLYS